MGVTDPLLRRRPAWLGDSCPHSHPTPPPRVFLAFFDNKGPIYTNYVPRGTMVDANHIERALGKFRKVFKKKRLEMAAGGLHTDPGDLQAQIGSGA